LERERDYLVAVVGAEETDEGGGTGINKFS
jgi:hypothetical protein